MSISLYWMKVMMMKRNKCCKFLDLESTDFMYTERLISLFRAGHSMLDQDDEDNYVVEEHNPT